MLTRSWMKCGKCGQRCSDYATNHTKQPSDCGRWIRTVCTTCKRFIGYKPKECDYGQDQPIGN